MYFAFFKILIIFDFSLTNFNPIESNITYTLIILDGSMKSSTESLCRKSTWQRWLGGVSNVSWLGPTLLKENSSHTITSLWEHNREQKNDT
jgi:hypothetical protein